jgi:hypothetical protein
VRTPLFVVAVVLALLAAGLYLGLGRPARLETAALLGEQDRLRAELETGQRRLAVLQQDEALRRQALGRVGGIDASSREAVTTVRRGLLGTLSTLSSNAIEISVRPGRGPTAADVGVRATVSLEEFVSLSEALARPGAGIALSRARIRASAPALAVEFEGSSLRGERP